MEVTVRPDVINVVKEGVERKLILIEQDSEGMSSSVVFAHLTLDDVERLIEKFKEVG